MLNEEQQRDQDALYHGIGRFVVNFSNLVGRMERGITMISGHRGGGEAVQAWHLGLAGIEANRIRGSYSAPRGRRDGMILSGVAA
jgi:hypothetical protein